MLPPPDTGLFAVRPLGWLHRLCLQAVAFCHTAGDLSFLSWFHAQAPELFLPMDLLLLASGSPWRSSVRPPIQRPGEKTPGKALLNTKWLTRFIPIQPSRTTS